MTHRGWLDAADVRVSFEFESNFHTLSLRQFYEKADEKHPVCNLIVLATFAHVFVFVRTQMIDYPYIALPTGFQHRISYYRYHQKDAIAGADSQVGKRTFIGVDEPNPAWTQVFPLNDVDMKVFIDSWHKWIIENKKRRDFVEKFHLEML